MYLLAGNQTWDFSVRVHRWQLRRDFTADLSKVTAFKPTASHSRVFVTLQAQQIFAGPSLKTQRGVRQIERVVKETADTIIFQKQI